MTVEQKIQEMLMSSYLDSEDEYDSDESSSPIPSPRLTPDPSPRLTSTNRPSFFKSLAHGNAPLSKEIEEKALRKVAEEEAALKTGIVPKIAIPMIDERDKIKTMSARASQKFSQTQSPRRTRMVFHDHIAKGRGRGGGKKSKRRKSKKTKRRKSKKSKRRKFSKKR